MYALRGHCVGMLRTHTSRCACALLQLLLLLLLLSCFLWRAARLPYRLTPFHFHPQCVSSYGLSKFVSGVLGARMSPTLLLGGGLMATAAINIAFGFGTSLAWFCAFWALNGLLQVGGTMGGWLGCCICATLVGREGGHWWY